MQSIFLCISVGTGLLLASTYSQSEPYDRSVLHLIASISLSAIVLCAVHNYYPSLFNATRDRRGHYDAIPLEEIGRNDTFQLKEQVASNASRLSAKNHIGLILVAIAALTVRIELYRNTSKTAQCASRTWEVILPLALALNGCRYQQRARFQSDEDPGSSVYDALATQTKSYILQPRWRYLPSACAVTYGCYAVTALWQVQSSTYICPIVSGEISSIPRLQQFALFLDCLLAITAQELSRSNSSSRHKLCSLPFSFASILFGTVLCWMLYTIVIYFADREEMEWFLVNDTPSTYRTIWLMLGQGLISSVFVLSSTYCILHHGIYQLSMVLTVSITVFLGISNLWSAKYPFPPNTSNTSVWAFLLIYFGGWSSYRIAQAVGQVQPSRSSAWQVFSFVAFLILVVPVFWGSDGVHFHPVDLLMYEAKAQHEQYIKYASSSTDLRSAVTIYRERYQNEPPPGFDKWYEYARRKSILIMDDYDQIHRDLLPFRTTPPADLRRQTWEMVSNPWNEISGITIRNGKADVEENVLPTHRWMLEGVATLINSFAQYLPDMDVAFNLNDESRVAVPNAKITALRNQATRGRFNGKANWSSDRASTWSPVAKEEVQVTAFENLSFQKNFRRYGSIGCSPDSLSVTHPQLSSQYLLCLKCVEPHSMGQFVSNWSLAADMCHQPDMSHLHGFYLSPAAFKSSHELMPVFSQSKASGYNDILYPSSWNYMDKVIYQPVNASGNYGTENYSPGYPDPPYSEKDTILYWRGATSEGVSTGTHTWRGMTRQRLVHLANNATSNSDHDRTTILLPDTNRPEAYTYQSLPGSALTSLGLQQTTDIKLVDHIARCGGVDCTDQEREFALIGPVDFQAHWKYKFLFDMDGAGFSGRFLPFLQSRSLPFKTALFREWYDSRITAWRHFVPIDIRLHGVWSTLAYFAGVDGVWPGSGGKKYKWEAHVVQGEIIAEEGREWAGKVLRKEDMEVYFFRLLLEWGRLTDDRRDELGFSMPS